MRHVNVLEAKTQLSALLREVASGDEVIITNHGRPVARLSNVEVKRSPRVYGALRAIPGRRVLTDKEIDAALAPMTDAEVEAEGWG